MAMDEVGLGQLLQQARQRVGLTQQELCQKADISYSTLAKIERGAIKSPSVFTIHKLSAAIGIGLDELLGVAKLSPTQKTQQKHKSKSGISFLFVDINGCLVRFFHEAFTRLAVNTGAPADRIESMFWHYNDAVCKGEMSLQQFNAVLSEGLGKPVKWEQYYLEAVHPIEEMHQLVVWASQYYRVGLLSNIMPSLIKSMLQKGLLPSISYDVIVDSSEVGTIKPEETIYGVAQQRANVTPDEILFVDDSRTNLMAAERLGWRVLWFDDFRPAESVKRVKSALEL
jgi:FMN phosphatase YigB (HAD superfamily)